MMMQVQEKRYYTPEEYLKLEVNSSHRHEYIDGEITSMTGGTPNHNRIAGNFYAALNFALKGKPYDVFFADQRLSVPRKKLYTYPDVMIVQGELQFPEGRRDTITNPIVIAEVLSKSTEGYDRGEKFQAYRTIPTVEEYVLIDQYTLHVEQFIRTESRKWLLTEYDGESATLSLASVQFEIMLANIYDKVDFEAEEQKA